MSETMITAIAFVLIFCLPFWKLVNKYRQAGREFFDACYAAYFAWCIKVAIWMILIFGTLSMIIPGVSLDLAWRLPVSTLPVLGIIFSCDMIRRLRRA